MYNPLGIILYSYSDVLKSEIEKYFFYLRLELNPSQSQISQGKKPGNHINVVDSESLDDFLKEAKQNRQVDETFESTLVIETKPITQKKKLSCYQSGVYYIGPYFSQSKQSLNKMERLISKKGGTVSHQFLRDRLNVEFLEQKQQIKELNELLQMAVHDLRSPLSAMVCYSELLMDGVLDNIKGAKVNPINIIHQNCEFLIDMVDDLLDSAQLEAGKKSLKLVRTNFNNIIQKVVRSLEGLARVKEITVKTHLDEIPDLFVDSQKMERIVINLLGNAIKFTKAKGSIILKCMKKGNNVVFSIQDMGPGIPQSDLENIFEKFNIGDKSKISGKGHGLGLAITKSFVEMHGGKIYVKSERHKGSTFVIHLSIEKRVLGKHRDVKKKVLVIDTAGDIPGLNNSSDLGKFEVVPWSTSRAQETAFDIRNFSAIIINEKFNYSTLGHSIFTDLIKTNLKHIPWFFLVPGNIRKEDFDLFEYLNIHILKKPIETIQLSNHIEETLNKDRRKLK